MSNKPRVFISHDGWLASEEKDDFESLIHALMFQDRFDIQGIAATASRWGGEYRKASDRYWTDRTDSAFNRSGTNRARTIYEDRATGLKDFEPRFDWIKAATGSVPHVRVSGDDHAADRDHTVSFLVDGVYRGTFATTADRAAGEWQDVTLAGVWKPASPTRSRSDSTARARAKPSASMA